MNNFKLGKRNPRVDPRTFKLANYVTQIPPYPAAVNWSRMVPAWGMMMNDQIGDCAIAAPGHMEMLWTSQTGVDFNPTDSQIVASYSQITGYQPGNPASDQGSILLDVMSAWRKTGIAGRRISAYAEIDCRYVPEISIGVYLFGGIILGVNLPQSAMDATDAQQCWTDTTDTNILGGHAVCVVAYDQWTLACVTWGQIQLMSWQWLAKYSDEAYVAFSPDWISASGVAPSGFNQQQLLADLSHI